MIIIITTYTNKSLGKEASSKSIYSIIKILMPLLSTLYYYPYLLTLLNSLTLTPYYL